MSLERIEHTVLWQKSLAPAENDLYKSKREELRSAFVSFRNNASQLVSRIAATLPGLTQHEISHLDALWETASLIAGKDYPINPLEGFILGGAILLHDSALCFEAYQNGIDGLRETLIWQDAHVATAESSNHLSEEEQKHIADFAALRHLHAEQAARLAEQSWIHSGTGEPLYLIENQNLRIHLGSLMGQIAASHHWSIEKVATTLRNQVNAPAGYPTEWRIDPIKIACLLRCADAAHIDNERAPDFLHALIKRQGVSFNHWQAQNKMSKVDLDILDSSRSTLLFTSTTDFREADSDAWWIAYDAVCLVEKEIKSCNALLESRNKSDAPVFQVTRVKGVESPQVMKSHITVEGWSPCSAELHVGNIEKLVKNLGGENLYGTHTDQLEITIRELVQNARDAIHARRRIEPGFQGKILIRLDRKEGLDWLIVEDDGVGMSERVLTGPLLDFGTSFWASSLVQNEFPGLRSSGFKPIGQFGIGFFSVFMIAEEVCVTSRSWREGMANTKQIHFKNGLSFRPILRNNTPADFTSSTSTQIKLRLKSSSLSEDLKIEIKRNTVGAKNLNVHVNEYLSAIVAGLDVDVSFSDGKIEKIVHQDITSSNFDADHWLRKISFSEYQATESLITFIEESLPRLRPIKDNDKILGLAAISTIHQGGQNFLSIQTIGGLATSVHQRDGSTYVGFIDYQPQSAKRDTSRAMCAASETAITQWAEEQYKLLKTLPLNHIQRHIAASGLSHFKVDPIDIATVLVSLDTIRRFVTFDELANLSDTADIMIFKSYFGNHVDTHHNINHWPGRILILPLTHGEFVSLDMSNGIPDNNYSIIDCLNRTLVKKGKNPVWTTEANVATSNLNMVMSALVVSTRNL